MTYRAGRPHDAVAGLHPATASVRRILIALCAALALLPAPAMADTPRVLVTSKPVHALVAAVMEGVAKPDLLIEGTASPHTYAMRPSDAAKAARAAVVFRVSAALEPFTEKLIRSLPRKVVVVTLADAAGVRPLPRRAGGAFEAHADRHGHADHAHDRRRRTPAADTDPHVWLDPDNAKAMLTAIRATLSTAHPAQAGTFAANAARYAARIDALTADIERDLAPVAARPFLVLHDAYQYFERRFELNAIGTILVAPDEQPSARRISTLRRKLRKLAAVCVFAEPNHQPRVIATVIEGSAARTAVLDPEGAGLTPGPGLYLDLLRRLSTAMRTCLAPAS